LNSGPSWNRSYRHFSRVKMVRNFVGRSNLARDLLMPGSESAGPKDSIIWMHYYCEKDEVNSLNKGLKNKHLVYIVTIN
jgi:hypothetical protein